MTERRGNEPVGKMSRRAKAAVLTAAVLALLVSLLDVNIVNSAAASIARSFGPGATARIPWLVSAYALAETVVQPIYGKLTDRVGPRPVLLCAVALFGVGSVLCGLAASMTVLIFLRVLQGLGAAGLLSRTFVLLGHLRTATGDDDAGAGNAAGGVLLAVGIVAGPLVGGLVVAHVDWRWVFWINVPVVAVVLIIMASCLRLSVDRRNEPIDWAAAAALAGGAAALQLVCVLGGQHLAWWSAPVVGLEVAGAWCVAFFAFRQRRSSAPFFPPELLRHRVLRLTAVLQLTAGLGLAATLYINLNLQLVRGYSALHAGLQLVAMAVGVVAGSVTGYVLARRGHPLKTSLVTGTALGAAALTALALCGPAVPVQVIWLALAVNGFGSGISVGNELTVIQDSVPLRDLGVATTGIRFVETLGTSVGATVFGFCFAHIVSTPSTPSSVIAAVQLIFGLGALLLVAATVAALRLPRLLPSRDPATGVAPAADPL